MIKTNQHTTNNKIKLINIEKELILRYIEVEFSVLLNELNYAIITLNHHQLLPSINNVHNTKDLKLRIDEINKTIKSLIELNTFEHLPENCLELCDLGSILEKMLPLIKIYGQDKNVIINSLIAPPLKINGNSVQLRSVFKQLLYLLIKEFETGGKIELFAQKECHDIVITINVYGSMRFEIAYEAICSIEEIFSKKFAWKTQATKLFFISNTIKQNLSKMTISRLSPFHRIISIILPANGSDINRE